MTVALIHGPNLNLLGQREPALYGSMTLEQLESAVEEAALKLGLRLQTFQSNVEGDLVGILQQVAPTCHAVIFNPGGFSHTSVAVRDAVASLNIPTVEVHLTHIHSREPFRRQSLTSQAAVASISGLGLQGYFAALEHLRDLLH